MLCAQAAPHLAQACIGICCPSRCLSYCTEHGCALSVSSLTSKTSRTSPVLGLGMCACAPTPCVIVRHIVKLWRGLRLQQRRCRGLGQGCAPCPASACGMPSIMPSLAAEMLAYERVTSSRLWLRILEARAWTRGCDWGDQEGRDRTCHTPYATSRKSSARWAVCTYWQAHHQMMTGRCQVRLQQRPFSKHRTYRARDWPAVGACLIVFVPHHLQEAQSCSKLLILHQIGAIG